MMKAIAAAALAAALAAAGLSGGAPLSEVATADVAADLYRSEAFRTWAEMSEDDWGAGQLRPAVYGGRMAADGRVTVTVAGAWSQHGLLHDVTLTQGADGWQMVSAAEAEGLYVRSEPVGRGLASAELEAWKDWFYDREHSVRAQFLTSCYRTPREIDAFELLYNGLQGESIYHTDPPSAESEAVLGHAPRIGVSKATVSDVNAALLRYTGLTLDETWQVNLGRMTYSAPYDAYYHEHGDTNHLFLRFDAGWETGNGTVFLRFRGRYDQYCQACLVPAGDGEYHFTYCRPVA